MSVERIASLVRLAAGSSDAAAAFQGQTASLKSPMVPSVPQVRALPAAAAVSVPQKASALRGQANVESKRTVTSQAKTLASASPVFAVKAAVAAPDADVLLPPEGQGQPSNPVIVRVAPLPAPAPVRQPAPIQRPQPAPTGQSQPAPGPGISPAGQPSPAPFRAPSPLGPFPWQGQPTPGLAGRGPMYSLPAIPVLRQPQPGYGPAAPLSGTPTFAQQQTPAQPPPNQVGPAFGQAEGCNCCLQVTGLVATVVTTAQTAITAITAIAQRR
jgi:hypothetical protein